MELELLLELLDFRWLGLLLEFLLEPGLLGLELELRLLAL